TRKLRARRIGRNAITGGRDLRGEAKWQASTCRRPARARYRGRHGGGAHKRKYAMTIHIADIHRATATLPPRLVIHGLEGVRKTTLAARFPSPVFLQTEDGTGNLELATFGLLEQFSAVRNAIAALGNESHDFRTLVLDSVDALEPLIWAAVCRERGWVSIEAPGYGKGYVEAD